MHFVPFVASDKILNIIDMAKMYNTLPSKILNVKDEYTAFCLNQACAYIRDMKESGAEPISNMERKKCTSFSDLYAKFK